MTNKILLLLVCLMTVLTFSACRIKNPSGNSGNGNLPENSDENNNAIYGEGIKTYIVIDGSDSDEAYTQFLNDLMYEIYMKAESSTVLANNTSEEKSHEIVLGNSERSVTQKAYEKLDRKINQVIEEEYGYNVEEDIIGYAIYSTGKSVAVVWNHERLKYDALNYFVDNYVTKEKLVLNDGYAYTETFSYTELLEQDDKNEREHEWNEVEKVLGAEATNALKNYYSLLNEDLYYWLADLYDPDIGGFYYSNSARNSEGYLPDIESTAQALAFLSRTMPEKNWMDILPDEMLEKILSFTKGLQSSTDGYFYHPQWNGMTYTVSDTAATFAWYLNGEETGTYTATFNAKNATWVQFEIRGSQYCAGNDTFNISFDNLYAAPHREDYRGKGENASTAQTFTGLTVLPTAPYKITSVDGGLKGNQGDANWTVIADGSTDAYLDIGRNGGTTGSTPLFWFAKDASAAKYVFETDIKWGGCNAASGAYPINVKFSDGKNSPSIAMYVNADGDLYINKNGVNLTLHKGLWFNLRIEITYVSDTEAIFDWYLNGDKVGSFTTVFNVKNATWVQYEIRGSQFCAGNDVFNIAFDNVYTGGQS